MAGPPAGFMANLDRKYTLMGRDVATRENAAAADINLANVRAALMPGESAASNALRAAQTAGQEQLTALAPERSFTENRQARATSALQESLNLPINPAGGGGSVGVGGAYGRGATTLDREMAERQRRGMPALSGGLGLQGPDDLLDLTPRLRVGFAKGTARVPGKGSGKVDTVNAKLAPGEAVLNKAAADMAGRGAISKLNAAGARKMGMI